VSLIDSDSIPSKIIKRDGRVVEFDRQKITEAIWKAIKSVGGQDRALAERLSNQVVERLGKQLKPGEIPHVEQVQDLVEKILVENNLYNVAKAYILYRALHAQIREFVDSYLENKSWLVKENANTTYSLQALNFHISSQVISQYWLHRIFNKGRTEIREAHLNGDFHIHNLGILGPYCFDDQTRVLTKEGFKFFKDVTLQDEVATVNLKTGYLEYQHPIDKQVFEYSGPLFCFESRSLSLRVTPEHRLLVRERGDKKWKFINPTNFKRRSEFLKQVKWRGGNSKFFQIPVVKGGNRLRHIKRIPMEVFLKFMGWYLAEGNAWRHDRKDRNSPDYIISIGQRNKKNRREIASLIKRLGFSPNLSEKDHIQFCSKELYFYLKQFGKSDEKFVPRFIKDLDPEKIEIFLSALFKGDGTIENGKLRRFSTRSKKLAEDVLECLLKIGKSGTLRWDGERFIVSVQTKQLTPIFNKHPKLVQYKGKVYDLTVPNGTLLVERNGRVVVSGNCVGWDLRDLLMTGFRGVRGKVSAKPAKHFRVALGHVVNFVFTLQGEAAGAQAFSNFDTYLAPFIRHDGLDYKSVKQALQEFMFNMNIPTRVGFQSLCWDEPIVIKERGKVKVVEIGRLVDREFEKYPYRVIEKHPQSYALENHDDYQVLSFNPDGKAVWTRVKAFVRHRVPKNSEFVRIRTNRGEARVSKAHSLFSFSRFNGEFNPVPKSAEDVKIADDYRHLNEENHFIALRSLENQGRKEEIDLVEIIDELPRLQKNVFVKINPTHTLKRVRERIILEEQSLVPFYKEFGIKDRGIWESWLKEKSIRYDVWRKYGDLSQKVEFKLKNSDVWYPRFLNGKLLENFVKLCAWYISEGHTAISTPLYVSQPPSKNARDIIKLLRALNALGQVARGKGYSRNGRKTKTVLEITGRGLLAEVVSRTCGYLSFNKVVPWFIFNLSPKYQKIFIKTLLKGDGSEYSKYWDYLTTSRKLSTSLSLLLSQNNFRFAVYTEKLNRNNKNWRDRFVIRIFKENSKPKKTYFVNDFEARICLGVEKFNYDKEYEYDISVDLPQENFIGGAGLLVFHNTPFSNVTLDLKVPGFMRDEPVIIGGEVLDATYGEFQEEMNIFNRALAEVMLEGDAVGRVFSVDGECLCPIKNSGRMKLVKIGEYIDEWMEKGKPLYIKENNCEVLDVRAQDIKALGLKDGKIDWCKVNFLVRHPTESLLKIFTGGGFNIKVTPSHSVMVLKEGKLQSFKASMLQKGDYLIMPKFMPLEERKPQVISLANEFAKNGVRGVYIRDVYKGGKLYRETRKAVQRRKYGKRIYEYSYDVPVFPLENIAYLSEFDLSKAKLSLRGSSIKLRNLLPLTKELAEFLGYYCAEGSAEKGGISLGFNLKEEREKAIRVAQLVRRIFRGVPVCLREVKDRNLIEVRVHSKLLRMVITEIFKVGTGTGRRVPQIIFEAPQEIKKSFLLAYFEGDAWLTENIVVNSVSRELIYGISVLLKQLGVFHTLTEYYRDGKPTWRITVWRDRKLHPKDSYSISKIPIKESGLEMVFEKILEKEPYYFDSLGRKYRNTKIRISKKFGISHSNSTSLQKVKNVIEYAKRLKIEIPPALKEVEKNNILFLKIKKIEKATPSNGMVYDFSTESENFVADQLLVHNTFPIPTINITRDFEWNDETTRTVLETSAKYGIPYFANFINSDMNPEDVRSMCLHPDEELLIRNSGSVRRETIGQVVEKYAGEFKNDGWADPVKEVEVLSLNPETWKTEWVKVKRFLKVTDNKMIKIVTEDGKTIRVSRNHLIPVVTINGIVNKLAKDVKPGDIVLTLKSSCHALATNYEKIGSFVLDEKLAELLGFFTADGNYLFENRKNLKTYRLPKGLQFTFGNNNPLLRKKVKKLIKDVLKCSVREKEDTRYDTRYFYVYSTDIARAFYNAGFKKYGRLPQVIFNSPPTVIKAFLKYFFLGDGYERNKEIHLNDRELARDLAILFTILGIPVCYKEKRKSQRIYIQHKKSKINSIGNQATPTLFERVPGRMAKSTYAVPGLNKSRMVGVETLSRYDAHTKESKKFINGDIMFVRVKKCELIELEKEQEFFDVELERNHLFIHSLGNITHNCCHLRLDKRELKKRGGGLFGANPLTGCYDEETEILTTKGWKKFKDLTLEDEIFTRKQDGTIEIHKPIRIFEYDWDGEMIRFKHKSLDLLVTPNHRMFVEYRDGKVWRNKFVEAKDFNPNSHRIPKQGVWNGNEEEYFVLPSVEILSGTGPVSRFSKEELEAIRKLKTEGVSIYQIAENFDCDPVTVYNICTKEKYGNEERTRVRYETQPLKIKMDDWLKFFGIWLTEGSVDNENIAAEHGYRIFITQVNRKKRKEIKELLDRLPFNYREEARSFVICNKQLWNYLRQFGNKYEKYIPQEIKNLSARQLKILFDWMVKGNGHIRKTTGQTTYWTSSDRLAADMQEIILKIGMISSIRKSKKRAKIKGRIINTEKCWTIGVQKSKYYRLRKRNISKVYYKGKVYCVEVPNHVIMVRRNGKSCWCGNSIGVVTINMPRIGFLSKSEGEFFARLDRMMVLAKDVLEIKRKWLEKFTEAGLYPYSRFYLRHIKEAFGQYWKNHFSTIGLIGMNEACLNFLGCSIGDPEGLSFTIKVLDYMRKRLQDFQEETGSIYNLEATPAEGTSHRLARIDKKTYPSIIVANEEEVKKGAAPYYTNSTHLPVYYTDDLWEYLRLQDPLQTKYTGGTVAHVWLGESNPPVESVASLVRKICENFKLPYFTLTPTFSICPEDGYLSGEQHTCPKCGRTTEVYSRVVGYLRPVEQWNQGKQEEFKQRKVFDKALVRKLSVSIASDA